MVAVIAALIHLAGMKDTPGPCIDMAATVAERQILWVESRGWPTADNPKSSAFGCGQLLVRQRKAYAQLCDTHHETVDVEEQMCMFRKYVKERYDTPERAWSFWKRKGWY